MPAATSTPSLRAVLERVLPIFLWLGLIAAVAAASAQTDELVLSVHRIFGYGGGSQIQGHFRLEASGLANLATVTFKIDDTVVATVEKVGTMEVKVRAFASSSTAQEEMQLAKGKTI